MRKSVAVALALMSFGLGGLLSAKLTARAPEGDFPIMLTQGQRVTVAPAGASGCVIERVASEHSHWVECLGGEWRNLATGIAVRIHAPAK